MARDGVLKKVWATVVVVLLCVIAVAMIDVAVMLHEGIEVEYVEASE